MLMLVGQLAGMVATHLLHVAAAIGSANPGGVLHGRR
jgi:hypothetical protein